MTQYLTLLDIIDQVNKSLNDKNYIAALIVALTIPDKCGKMEYTDEQSVGKRYAAWYDVWCGFSNCSESTNNPPDVTGKIIYKLRCALLHDNSTDLQFLSDEEKIDEFALEMFDNNDYCFSVYTSSIIDEQTKQMRIRIIDLCKWICYGAKVYYQKNTEKFNNVSTIKIVDHRDILKWNNKQTNNK